jgi:PAS domain S-box-containing protein
VKVSRLRRAPPGWDAITPAQALVSHAIGTALVCLIVWWLRAPTEILIALPAPSVGAALIFRRWVYLTMTAIATVTALPVLYALSPDITSSLRTVIGVTGSAVLVAELVRWTSQTRRDAEAARAESDRRFRLLAENATDIISVLTPAGTIRYISPAVQTLLGYLPADQIGTRWDVHIHEPDLDTWRAACQRAIANATAQTVSYRIWTAAGDHRWLETSIRPVRVSPRGPIDELHTASRDITPRIIVEAELRRVNLQLEQTAAAADAASRSKSEFLANMSHEIRTPLNAIIGLAELLRDDPLSAQQRHSVSLIENSGQTLLRVIDDILDFSKVEAGRLTLMHEPFDPVQAIRDVVAILQVRAQQQGITLQAELTPGCPPAVLGDGARVRQVLLNLIGNAIKFTSRGGVTVTVAPKTNDQGEWLQVRVIDTGIGIDAAAQSRLFEPFTQAESSTARRFGGTGLGLAISRRLIALMGGRIGLSSEVGAGSTFWFEIPSQPVAQDPAPAAEVMVTASRPTPLRLKILLAEDNPANRMVAQLQLSKVGCEVVSVEDGRAAIEHYQAHAPDLDLILMDCQMPEVDGFDATRAIRAWERTHGGHIPIVALSANALAGDREQSLAAGMDDHLVKPATVAALRATLMRWGGAGRGPAPGGTPAPAPLELGDDAPAPI